MIHGTTKYSVKKNKYVLKQYPVFLNTILFRLIHLYYVFFKILTLRMLMFVFPTVSFMDVVILVALKFIVKIFVLCTLLCLDTWKFVHTQSLCYILLDKLLSTFMLFTATKYWRGLRIELLYIIFYPPVCPFLKLILAR